MFISPDAASNTISQARQQTIQSDIHRDPENRVGVVWWLARAGLYMPAWWSPSRDSELRNFWKKSDHLSGAVFTMTAKMTAIPVRILARDSADRVAALQADGMTELLYAGAEFGDGWSAFYSKFVEDLISQDNGAFAEVIGPGNPVGPLSGPPTSIAHLDSFRCTRTGNPEFPVVYEDTSGKRYKLHYTRVMFSAQQPSPIKEMFGVGFSSVSRCLNVAQTLVDILTYKMEKLGSRPMRGILVTKGGLDPEDVRSAFTLAEAESDNAGTSRYSKIVMVGNAALEEAGVDIIDLNSLPDGFDEETSINLGMATIALGFGLDPRELFPGISQGTSRAEALLQHLKQRGKGPGQVIEITERLFNQKFLPPHLKMQFDFQDDAEDRSIAEIKKLRSERRNLDLNSKNINQRTSREQMLDTGDLTQTQFIMLELEDGRLKDGTDVINLMYTDNNALDLGVNDPLDLITNDVFALLPICLSKLNDSRRKLANAKTDEERTKILSVVKALEATRDRYIKAINSLDSMTLDDRIKMQIASEQKDNPFMLRADQGRQISSKNPASPDFERAAGNNLPDKDTSLQQSTDENPSVESGGSKEKDAWKSSLIYYRQD